MEEMVSNRVEARVKCGKCGVASHKLWTEQLIAGRILQDSVFLRISHNQPALCLLSPHFTWGASSEEPNRNSQSPLPIKHIRGCLLQVATKDETLLANNQT